jgi:ribokinase
MPEGPLDLVVVGDINPDIVVTGAEPRFGQHEQLVPSIEQVIGGSAGIMAVGAARLGLRVALVGVVGDDRFGQSMLADLTDRGVDVTRSRTAAGRPTGATVVLTRGDDRAILTSLGTISDLTADDVTDDLLARARHVHIASWFLLDGLRPGAGSLVARAHAAGATVSIDPNWDPKEAWDDGLLALLPKLDVLLPNAAEARGLSGATGVDDAGRILAVERGCRWVVVKLGQDGAMAFGSDGAVIRAVAHPVDAVDATGAGDAFDAAYLAGIVAGLDPAIALERAVVAGALSTRAAGGTAGQATAAQIDEALGLRR